MIIIIDDNSFSKFKCDRILIKKINKKSVFTIISRANLNIKKILGKIDSDFAVENFWNVLLLTLFSLLSRLKRPISGKFPT